MMAVIDSKHFEKRWYLATLMFITIIQLFLTSSPLYGYSSILVIFKNMNLYKQLCETKENMTTVSTSNITLTKVTEVTTCHEQDKALNLFFVVGMVAQQTIKFIIGYAVDKVGAQICSYIGCIFMLLFSFTLAYAKQGTEYMVFISFIFLAFGSSILILCGYQIVNMMFKKRKALFLCIISGAIDSSTAEFVIYLVAFQHGLPLRTISLFYGVLVVVFIVLTTAIFYPRKEDMISMIDNEVNKMYNSRNKQLKQKDFIAFSQDLSASYHGGVTSNLNAYANSIQNKILALSLEERREEFSLSLSRSMGFSYSQDLDTSFEPSGKGIALYKRGAYGMVREKYYNNVGYDGFTAKWQNSSIEKQPLVTSAEENPFKVRNDVSLRQCIFSTLNILGVIMTSIIILKLLYFIGNLDKYFRSFADEKTGIKYTKYFGLIQFTGFIVGPLTGILFQSKDEEEDKTEEEIQHDNMRKLIMPLVIGMLSLTLMGGLQLFQNTYLSIPIFILFLTTNGMMWSLTSTFYALLFPPQLYCSIYGLCIAISGSFSLLQYPLLTIEQKYFDGNQFWTNLLFFVLSLTTFSVPIYLKFRCWCFEHQKKATVNKLATTNV